MSEDIQVRTTDAEVVLWLILKKLDPADLEMLLQCIPIMGTGHFADFLAGVGRAIQFQRNLNDTTSREA